MFPRYVILNLILPELTDYARGQSQPQSFVTQPRTGATAEHVARQFVLCPSVKLYKQ